MSLTIPIKKKPPAVDYLNSIVSKKELSNLILQVYADYGTAKAALLANALKNLGFKYATLAGITVSIDDLEVPEIKKTLIANSTCWT